MNNTIIGPDSPYRTALIVGATLLGLHGGPAGALPVMDFEGLAIGPLGTREAVNSYYAGGSGGNGTTGGIDIGINFQVDVEIALNLGPTRAHSGVNVLTTNSFQSSFSFDVSPPNPQINNRVSLWYAINDPQGDGNHAIIDLYDGLGGSLGGGNLIGTSGILGSTGGFSNWRFITVATTPGTTIGSVEFRTPVGAGTAVFDDVRVFIPAPSSLLLLLVGATGIGHLRRSRRTSKRSGTT